MRLVHPAEAAVGLAHEDHDLPFEAIVAFGRVHAEHPGVVVVEDMAHVETEIAARRRHVEHEQPARRE